MIVFDATNVERKDRSPLINIARGLGYNVVGLRIVTPIEICLARNAARSPDRQVPEITIKRFFNRLDEPLQTEGFSEIRLVDGTK